MLDAVTDAILIFDPQSFQIVDVNKRATELYGYSRSDLLKKQLQDLTNEIPTYAELLHPLPGMEAVHINSNGEGLEFLVTLSLVDYWGRKAVLSINRDIRESKRVQATVAANEKKFRCLIHNISEIVALIDVDGTIRFISPQAERVLGTSTPEIVGQNVFDFIHPEERGRAKEEYKKTLRETGEAVPSVLKVKSADGNWVPFEIIANNQIHEPDIGGVIFTARDLRYRRELEDAIRRSNRDLDKRVQERTMDLARANAALRLENQQRRYTEKQLQESLSLLNASLESTADGILVVSTDGAVRSYNEKFLEMWRIPRSTLATSSDQDLLRWASPQMENPEEFLKRTRKLYASPDEISLDVLRLKDGRIFERYCQPQKVASKTRGRVWSFRDVTHAQRLQEELHQAQKMEAVGRLAWGVAHDFNNVLMLISGCVAQMREDTRLPQTAISLCKQLDAAAKRGASLTRQLLAFSRKHPVTPQVVDLNGILSDLEKMLPRLLSDLVRLDIAIKPDILPVYADRSQIELMIINLALNARDAMPDGGTLSITTKEEALDPCKAGCLDERKDYIVLQITDTGHGMTPEIMSRILEPFFTTKAVGHGTGLGLSTAYGIVEQAGGHMTVESEPDHGTTFRVYFPRTGAPVSADEAGPPPRPRGGPETILLVEDEEGIRMMTQTYLESLGYRVLEADGSLEAVRISRDYRDTIHLLLSDILIPGMRGDELAHLIQQERPGLRTIFMSGYSGPHGRHPHTTTLLKPFAFPELGARIRETLDSAAAQPGGHELAS